MIIDFRFCPGCSNKLQQKILDGRLRLVCNQCGFVFWNNPKPTTSIILEKNKKILLLQRSEEPFRDYWVLPGGYVENDENPALTIKREVKEETGLDVIINKIVAIYLIDNDPRGNSIDIVYFGIITGGKLRLKEHNQAKFFSPNDLPNLIAYKHREVVINWYKNG